MPLSFPPPATPATPSPFENARKQINEAARLAKFRASSVARLMEPERVLEAPIVMQMDDGRMETFVSFRSQHNSARGPYKGGIRFHPGVTKDEVMALSVWMSIKTAVMDLPLGGGKGGVVVDPSRLSRAETERLSREYVRRFHRYLGAGVDVPAPDVNTNGQIMAWMTDEFSALAGRWCPGSFTGKPLTVGGSRGRERATAQGGYYVLCEHLRAQGRAVSGSTVAIEGAGNAGLILAEILAEAGARIVAISDSRGAVRLDSGLDPRKLRELKSAKGGTVASYPGAQAIGVDELLELKVDILAPCALENRLTADNAGRVKAGVVLELANGPTTPEADAILFRNGVTVLPDILANAGGVTVSYFEQVQNDANFYWTDDEVRARLEPRMRAATRDVTAKSAELGRELRMGAFVLAMTRIIAAMEVRSA